MNNIKKYLTIYKDLIKFMEKENINKIDFKEQTLFKSLCKYKNIKYNNSKIKNYAVMFDLARGATYKISYIKDLLVKYSLFGINEVWFYLEDNLDIDIAYFGYLRGKYSYEELKELDNFAYNLGIELVFSIQTLGHMENFLKWPISGKYADQPSVLLARDDNVYNLITKIIKFCKKSFKSTKINIGLDETYNLGQGNFLRKYGYCKTDEIFLEHVKKVYDICKKEGYKNIMMWSDMFFKIANKDKGYYDSNLSFDNTFKNKLPKDLTLIYWDYYNRDSNIIRKMVNKHLELTPNIVMASGYWTWQKPIIDFNQAKANTSAMIEVSLENNIDTIVFTMWNDDGAYVDFNSSFLAVLETSRNLFSLKDYKKIYKYIMKEDEYKYEIASKINNIKLSAIATIYDDPILGIYLNNEASRNINNIKDSIKLLKDLPEIKNYKEYNLLRNILILKLDLRIKLVNLYNQNKDLKILIDNYKKLIKYYKDYLKLFRKRWLNNYLPYNLELHEFRLANQIIRIKSLIDRIKKGPELIELKETNVLVQELPTIYDFLKSSYKVLI